MGMFARSRRWIGRALGAGWSGVHRLRFGRELVLEIDIDAADRASDVQMLIVLLDRIAADLRVVGVILWLRGSPGGWSAADDLRKAIARLRAAGKRVVAWASTLDNAGCWVGAAADALYVAPGGEVGLVGLGTELVFFGELLDRVGVQTDFEAAGAYKSFGETWSRRHASPENREAVQSLLEDLQATLLRDLAADRGLTEEEALAAVFAGPLTNEEAEARRIIDGVRYPDEVRAALEELGPLVDLQSWERSDRLRRWLRSWGTIERVCVLHLEGPIVMEEQPSATSIDADTAIAALEDLAEDDSVRGVVLHVDSPGGSALASDLIWRAVVQLQERKPVVAAFGDVAASGGFYLAAPVRIVARPTTLTGSIGVFGGKVVATGLLRTLGVAAQPVLGAPNAAWDGPLRPFNDEQRARFRVMLGRTYDAFVERVASGRGRPVEEVEPHCRGRVWTGRQAHALGLVEELGALDDAIRLVSEAAGFEPERVDHIELHPVPMWRAFVESYVGGKIPGLTGMAELALLREPRAVWAMLPFRVRVR